MSEELEDSSEPAVPDPLKCGKCGYGARSAAGSKTHQRGQLCLRNQGINVPATFRCEECGRLFPSQHGLSIHLVTHGSLHRANLAAPFEEDVEETAKEYHGNVEVFRGRMLQWKASFLRLRNGREVNPKELDQLMRKFSDELSKCIDFLPGPRNPNKKYIDMRKKPKKGRQKNNNRRAESDTQPRQIPLVPRRERRPKRKSS
ncbi:hypothetical protein RvY_05441 [Ramazzottius varieornatus]|uniref:C2H2-type domain-containing protein n=1 Tax=Ramazzottius varieornatus TaxID=947166 RepID=A0A1D1UVM1_RAMVA|nr:hypothetical protein RvY_05441 [Ramazzottius varieornatus]